MKSILTPIKRYGYLAIWLIILTTCRPRGILSSKQMEDLLVDMHTMDGMLQEGGYNYGHDEAVRGYYLMLLKEHGTTQVQFDSSLVWYTANPTIFNKIYPHVIDRLQAQYDAYIDLMKRMDNSSNMSIDDWLNRCQYGIDKGIFEKKYEKNIQKFVYVKKML